MVTIIEDKISAGVVREKIIRRVRLRLDVMSIQSVIFKKVDDVSY